MEIQTNTNCSRMLLPPMDERLHKSISSGNVDELKELLSGLSNPCDFLLNQVTYCMNYTSLHLAVMFNSSLVVHEICTICPSLLTKVNSTGETPLHIAAFLGLSNIASILIKYSDQIGGRRGLVMMTNNKKETAMHEAVRKNHLQVVKLLLDMDPFIACMGSHDGSTPIQVAASRKHNVKMIQLLYERCTECWENFDTEGRNFFHVAAQNGSSDIIKHILHQRERST